jgi:neurotransmitter:Na+ symporter, NSS family
MYSNLLNTRYPYYISMTMNTDKSSKSQPSRWSSQLSFILAATGAAVGLGNIWKFPYEVANNGGSAFVITYIILLICLGIPILIAEIALGKLGRASPITTIQKLASEAHASKTWCYLGVLSIVTLILVLSFYSVVAGWSIIYLIDSIKGTLINANIQTVNATWHAILNNPSQMIVYHAIFMALTMSVIIKGVNKGLERANKIMMPLLFLCLIVLVIFAIQSPGFDQGLHYLLAFKYEDITINTVINALGQTCFSLAIGAGAMLVYGSYVKEGTNLGSTACIIAIINMAVALLIGLAMFPIIFSYNLTPTGGPGLIFQILPVAFSHMPFGSVFSSIFFLLILFAAWTSSISMAEPVVIMLIEKTKYNRLAASIITGLITWVLGIASVLSFNVWSSFKILGDWNIFTFITDLTTNVMLPCGILGYTIFAGWKLRKDLMVKAICCKSTVFITIWHFLLKYIAPIAVILILLRQIYIL